MEALQAKDGNSKGKKAQCDCKVTCVGVPQEEDDEAELRL